MVLSVVLGLLLGSWNAGPADKGVATVTDLSHIELWCRVYYPKDPQSNQTGKRLYIIYFKFLIEQFHHYLACMKFLSFHNEYMYPHFELRVYENKLYFS